VSDQAIQPPVPAGDDDGSPPNWARADAERIEEAGSADGADVLEDLPRDRAAGVAEYLDPVTAAGALAEMHPPLAASVIADMRPPEAAMVLAAMRPDDRVDVLAFVPNPLRDVLVAELDADDQAEVRQLEQYPPDTAGGIMTTRVTSLSEHLAVDDAITLLRQLSDDLEQVFYVYVVDPGRRLRGVLSMRDLVLARPDRRLRDVMRHDVRSVPATMDQEEVARVMRKYGYLAMPAVDEQQRLVGLVTADDVAYVLEEEATEDVHRMFGAGAGERLTSPWGFSFSRRLPWMLVNLTLAFSASAVIAAFEGTIAATAVLAVYLPVVAGMGGNASAQAMAVLIRGMAVEGLGPRTWVRVLWRELRVGLLTGLVTGAVAAAVALTFHHDHGLTLGLLVGLALVVNHTVACLWGVTIPYVMWRLGFDPAQSATIFTTTLTDVVGFLTLLGLASLFLL
jgi:magnesium transporter